MTANRQTQQTIVKADLLAGMPVDPVGMFDQGITRLSSIIHRLRCRGWPVITERNNGNGTARYYLPDGWQPA